MSRESAITIERMRNEYCIPRDHTAPDELRAQLDRLAQSEVLDACRRSLAPWVNDHDTSIWLISSIDVDLAMDAGAKTASGGAAAWGEQLAREIARAIERGPGTTVLRFADRPAYVAQWARDMVAGQAWNKWYYREFDSLRSLPQSAAIAEGIIREGEQSLTVLLRLQSVQALDTVLDLVSNAGAQRVYDAVLPPSPGQWKEIVRWAARLLSFWRSFAPRIQDSPEREALRFAVQALAEWPLQGDEDDCGLREAVDGLLALRRVLDAATPEMARQILAAHEFATEFAQRVHAPIDSSLREFVRRVSGGDPDWAAFAAGVVAPHSVAPGAADETVLSELGGIFLLASAFRDLEINRAMLVAAERCDSATRDASVLCHLLAVRCLGRSRAALAVQDRAVAEFAAIPPGVTLSEMAETLATADVDAALRVVSRVLMERSGENLLDDPREHHGDYFAIGEIFPELRLDADRERSWSRLAVSLLRNFAARLPGFTHSSPEYIFQNFLAGTSQLRMSSRRIEVRLPQSPLSVVLRIAGMYCDLTLPWREGVEICLQAPPA